MCGDRHKQQPLVDDDTVTFIDDHSRHTCIFLMRHKNEVFAHFHKLKNRVEKEMGKHVLCVQSDRVKEYFSKAFSAYL